MDNSSALYPRLSVDRETWQRAVSCVLPVHAVTATQLTEPRNQYYALQQQRWERYYSAVDSSSAVVVKDSWLRYGVYIWTIEDVHGVLTSCPPAERCSSTTRRAAPIS